jgi:tetratricopeptide (TPR) repeat protein
MKETTILLFTILLCFNIILKSQTLQDPGTNINIENAQYLKEDLTKLLQSNVKYEMEALKSGIEGDVVLSFIIDKNGKLDSLNIISSPHKILSASSITSFNHVQNEWSPCKINGKPIDKRYLSVFRYRLYLNTQPPNYKEKAEKLVEKQKYENALKYFDKAIKENQLDYKLFDSRSKIKEILNDDEGAKKDSEKSKILQNEIISIVDITAIGTTRVEKRLIMKEQAPIMTNH